MARAVEIPVVVKKGTLSRSIEGESAAAFKRMGASGSAVAPLGRMLGKIRSDADEFTKSIEASNARVIAFGASVGVINGISMAFKQLVSITVSVEKSLTDINVVLNANKASLKKFGDGLFKVAKNTAQSFEVVAEAATEFARQGLSLEETLKRTNDALILTRLTGLKAAASVKGLTAATNGFAKAGLTTTQIINKLAAVDVKFAVSADDLIDALSRTGAVAQDAGVSFDNLIGMVTAAQQTTARGGAVIGNAFKTIFTRVQRPETLKTLRSLKIAVDDVSGAVLPADKILQNLANSYDGLSRSAKDAVNQQVAGVFQINILKAAVGDLQKQNSIAARATQVSANATDQATKKNEMLNQTIAALSTQTGLALTELAKKIGDIALAPGMRDIVSSFKALVEGATKGLDGEGTGSKFAKGLLTGIGNVLTGPGLIVIGGVFLKLFKDLTIFGVKSMKNLLGLNNAAKAQAALQQGIGQLLATNVQYENAMTAAAGNLNKQAAITQTYLAKEITMRQAAAALTGAMAGSAFAGGYRVSAAGDIGKKSRMFGGGRRRVPGFAPTEGVPNFNPWSKFGSIFNKAAMKNPVLHEGRGHFNRLLGQSHEVAAMGGRATASDFIIRKQAKGSDITSGVFAGFDFKAKPMYSVGRGDMKQFNRHRDQGGKAAVPVSSFHRGSLKTAKGRRAPLEALKSGPYQYSKKGEDLTAIGTSVNLNKIRKDWHLETARELGVPYPGKLTEGFLSDLYGHPGFIGHQMSQKNREIWSKVTNVEIPKSNIRRPGLERHFGQGSIFNPHLAPNFAPIGDAVRREKHQVGGLLGISPSQVQTRVVQNTALRSSFNPQGFGVISPTVGQHSFSDAARMHRGQDLRTVNMAPDIPGIDPLGGRSPLSLTATGYSSTIKTIISGVTPGAAKDLGTATAKSIIAEGKKSYPTPSKRGISLTSGINTKEAAAMAKAGGGLGNTAMNAFMAYSLGTMVDPMAQSAGLAPGVATGTLTGGYLGRAGGGAASRYLAERREKRGKGFGGKGLGWVGMLAGAVGGGAIARGESVVDDIQRRGFSWSAIGNALNPVAPDARSPAKRMQDEMFRTQINTRSFSQLEQLRSRGNVAQFDLDELNQQKMRDEGDLAIRGESGMYSGLDLSTQETAIRRKRAQQIRNKEREQFVAEKARTYVGQMAGAPVLEGGPSGLQMRNILSAAASKGKFHSIQEFMEKAQKKGPSASEVDSDVALLQLLNETVGSVPGFEDSPAQTKEKNRIKMLGMDDWLKKGFIGPEGKPTKKGRDEGIFASFEPALKALGDYLNSSGGKKIAEGMGDIADELRDLDQSASHTENINKVKDDIRELAAEMKNVNRFTSGFSSSLATAFSTMTTGSASASDAFRSFAVSVLQSINKMNSEAIAQQITAGLFGGAGTQNFLKGMLGGGRRTWTPSSTSTTNFEARRDPGRQLGGIIKAQNGMYVSGSRTGDKNPALLEDGEYVLNRNAVKAMGGAGALDAVNFNMAPRFQGGGPMSLSPGSGSLFDSKYLPPIEDISGSIPDWDSLGPVTSTDFLGSPSNPSKLRISGHSKKAGKSRKIHMSELGVGGVPKNYTFQKRGNEWREVDNIGNLSHKSGIKIWKPIMENGELTGVKMSRGTLATGINFGESKVIGYQGGGFSGFMSGVGKGISAPFRWIGELLSKIFKGGGGGRETSPMITGAGSSAQSRWVSARKSKISETDELLSQFDAISTRHGAAPAATVDPKMAGIERRVLAARAEKQLKGSLKAYGGIRPGALGLPGQAIDGQWSGGRTHAFSDQRASQRLTDLMHEGAEAGGPEALMPMLIEFGNNPAMLDGFNIGGVKFGPNVSLIRKIAALQTMMEKRGIQGFRTGGRLVSPIAGSGVSSKGLDKILGKYASSSPVRSGGVAIGGGGGAGRLGITAPNLSGFAHSNDPTLQNVRGDIREWHNEEIQKKFEKQAKRDELMQTIVGAALSAGVNAAAGGVKGMMAKGDAYEVPTGTPTSTQEAWGGFRDVGRNTKLSRWGRFKSGARGFNPVTGARFKHMFTTKGVPRGQSGGQVDNIPALLTGGEFVVNAPTVKRYGSGFFQKFQEGGLVGDQKFVPAEQKTAGNSSDRGAQKGGSSNTTINITINSSSGEGSTDTSGEPDTDQRQMAVKIRDAVVSVIKQEKRTGGILRDVTAQDQ